MRHDSSLLAAAIPRRINSTRLWLALDLARWIFESGGQKDVCLRGVCLSDRLPACRKWTGYDGVVLVVGHELVPLIDRAGLRFWGGFFTGHWWGP